MLLDRTRRGGWYLSLVIASTLARGWSAVCMLWIFIVLKRASHTQQLLPAFPEPRNPGQR